jgi:hypothetical protein
MTTETKDKIQQMSLDLQIHFSTWNFARVKFLALFTLALIKTTTVLFRGLVSAFESGASSESRLRRIRRFLRDYPLDFDDLAVSILSMLKLEGKLILILDRTNWKFGTYTINILTLAVAYKTMAVPIFWILLDKDGSTKTLERIDIMNRFIKVFGIQRIDYLLADREFIGELWFKWLIDTKICFHIRLKSNAKIGKRVCVRNLYAGYPYDKALWQEKRFKIYGIALFVTSLRRSDTQEWVIIVSNCQPQKALERYKIRWQIEHLFKALKSKGFKIEETHLQNGNKIAKLFALLTVAFVWCYLTGVWRHEQIKKIRILKHGRPQYSFFQYGLDFLKDALLNSFHPQYLTDALKLLSGT